MTKVTSLAGLVLTLAIAYGFDRWEASLRVQVARTFAHAPLLLWLASIANLFLAGTLFVLAWFVTVRAKRSELVNTVFVTVGLLTTFATAITYSAASTFLPLGIMEFLIPHSRVVYAAAFATVIGIAGFVLPCRESPLVKTRG